MENSQQQTQQQLLLYFTTTMDKSSFIQVKVIIGNLFETTGIYKIMIFVMFINKMVLCHADRTI